MTKIGQKENRKKRRKTTVGDIILMLILFVAIMVAVLAGYKIYSIMMEYKAGVDEYSEIADTVITERAADVEEVKKLKDVNGKETIVIFLTARKNLPRKYWTITFRELMPQQPLAM